MVTELEVGAASGGFAWSASLVAIKEGKLRHDFRTLERVMKTDSDYDRGYQDGMEEGKQDMEALEEHLKESREEAYEKGAELAKLQAENKKLREQGQDSWVSAAIAEQEEHIKRQTSCQGVIGKAHSFRSHGRPKDKAAWSECIVCGVTKTPNDYATKTRPGAMKLEGRCTNSHAQRGRCVLYEGHRDRYPYEDHVYPSALDQRLHDIALHEETHTKEI